MVVIAPSNLTNNSSDRNAIDVRWSGENGYVTVPYVIAPDLGQCQKLYLVCVSYVGFIGGEQNVYVSPYCTVGNICHELLHSLGFYHEHSRVDREDHIQIHFENVIKGKENNFNKVAGNTLDLPYDLGSILHYGRCVVLLLGKATVIPKNVNEQIGQRTHLSELDVRRLHKLYKCGDR
ncbi:LOW QUALITY PROTEIN: low choriolytic enzyme [Alosa pseudoharengus]|uniref:LOW QUALITY PROTEIN: low choriolytic enzyme n=1 Tax=Alosa pseudoharengus TaxID=34774 RepID=UPI003F8BF906